MAQGSAVPIDPTSSTDLSQKPAPRFSPRKLYSDPIDQDVALQYAGLLSADWVPIFEHGCDFEKNCFFEVLHYLVRNPNVNSSVLFRADILYDSKGVEIVDVTWGNEKHETYQPDFLTTGMLATAFEWKRTVIRKFIPRNDSLDRPIIQTVYYYEGVGDTPTTTGLMLMYPHVSAPERMPFYHPAVKGVAYLYSQDPSTSNKTISVHYQVFPDQDRSLTDRQVRTARNLLGTLYKHGQGKLEGYQKRVHHDQIIEQKRLQDTFADLKREHAHRLIQKWVEVTDPKKQVFEQIGIAAFLIELWKDMYMLPGGSQTESEKPPFPGFVDVGCGNGVLVELLLLSGYKGWGIEGHRRKTWATLTPETQRVLVHGIVVPAPLDFIADPETTSEAVLKEARESIPEAARSRPKRPRAESGCSNHSSKSPRASPIKTLRSWLSKSNLSSPSSPNHPTQLAGPRTNNGIYPPFLSHSTAPTSPSSPTQQNQEGPFLISNHADQLTAWIPLLASLTNASFFVLPCCSHNLSGERFRAPSYTNGFSADGLAPAYFAAHKEKVRGKHIAIPVQTRDEESDSAEGRSENGEACDGSDTTSLSAAGGAEKTYRFINGPQSPPCHPPVATSTASSSFHSTSPSLQDSTRPDPISQSQTSPQAAETGDLNLLSRPSRAKQPSAYQALCSWVVYLADKAGYLVEREYLRIPSTRNYGIVGRFVKGDNGNNELHKDKRERRNGEKWETERAMAFHRVGAESARGTFDEKMEKVLDIVDGEGGASREKWIGVCEREVVKGKDLDHF